MASSALGSLVVELVASTASFQESMTKAQYAAQQSMSGVTSSVNQMSGSVTTGFDAVTKGLDGLNSAVNVVKGAFAAFGVGLSIAGVVEYTRSIVLAAESLRNMSKVTGSTVEDLSKLSNAARVSGIDFDTFKLMVERMASNMETVSASSTKAQNALKFLGITARDPAQALQDVAVALDKYADGAGKAAIAKDLFGKGGPEMVAALHAMATATDDLITTTTADAEAAAKLSEQVRLLGIHMTALKDAILREVVPALSGYITGIEAARKAGLGWFESFRTGTTATDRIAPALKEAQDELVRLNAELKVDQGYFGNWSAAILADIDEVNKRIATLTVMRGAAGGATANPQSVYGEAWSTKPELDYSSVTKGAKLAADAVQKFIDALITQALELGMSQKELLDFRAMMAGAGDQAKVWNDIIVETTDRLAREKSALEQAKKLWEEQNKAIEEARKTYEAYGHSLDVGTQKLQLELATVGMSKTAIEEYTLSVRIKEAAERGDTDTVAKLTEQMRLLQDIAGKEGMVKAAKDIAEEYKRTAKTIEDALVGALTGVLTKGKDLFQQLKDFALKLFEQLVLRPILAPIAGGLAGLFTPGAAGANPLGGGGLGNLSSFLPTGGLMAGAGELLFGVGSAGAAAMGAGFSAGLATLGIAAEAGTAAIGGTAAALGAMAAVAVPVVGWIIAAGILAYSIFGSSGGGPKSGGSASLGDVSGIAGLGTGDAGAGRWFTPNTADAQLATTVQTMGASYKLFLASLGGKGTAGFALGFDTDPQGTAQSRLSIGATVGGKEVYGFQNRQEGTGTTQLNADMTIEAQRAVLAALQASDLPKDIAAILNSILASTATADQIAKVMAYAEGFKLIGDLMARNPLTDATNAIKTASQGAAGAFATQTTGLKALMTAYDGSIASTAALTAATNAYYAAGVQLLIQIEQIRASISTMFGDTIRAMTLQTLDPAAKYKYYQSEASSLEAQLLTATDPAQIAALTAKINADLMAAFGLLTPAQQISMLGQFTDSAARINKESDARLKEIEKTTQHDMKETLDAAKELINEAARALKEAADKQNVAGDKQIIAANTPKEVDVNVNITGKLATETNQG